MRQPFDAYETPDHYVAALLHVVQIGGCVFEPCDGDGAISRWFPHVITNDIRLGAHDWCEDATKPEVWERAVRHGCRWAVTNPPYRHANAIVSAAIDYGPPNLAFLLQLSFLEPTQARATMLADFPPAALIVLPRHRFVGRGTDSVTCAWMLWGPVAERLPRRVICLSRQACHNLARTLVPSVPA